MADIFAGSTGGPGEAGGSGPPPWAWFDGDDTSMGICLGNVSYTWDVGTSVSVARIRIRWAFGGLLPGGAAGAFAIDTGTSSTGPWTEVLADDEPHVTAGQSYPGDFETTYDLASTATARYWRFRSTTSNNNDIFTIGATAPDVPVEPDPDPNPYVPPLPGGPILEIYTADPDGDKWDVALWDTGVWADSGWQDVTPEGVLADISTGTEDTGMGILARPDAAAWQVTTYDPDRRLDPANDASPFVGYLRPGLPIRISHAGVVLRTGIVTRLAYSYERRTGAIGATDSIATLARARVPESALAGLGASLWARAADVIDAANVPVTIRRGRPEYDAPLSDPPDGERSAWDHIFLASQEVLAIPYVYSDGAIGWQFWSRPLERGTVIGAPNLTDLTAITDGRGLYSTIRALTDAPPAVEELSGTPTPDYGDRLYDRTVTTIDADAWVAAVLADRFEGGLRFIPGEVVCFTAADVAYFADVRIGELVTMSTPDVTVTGIVLGVRFRVAYDQSGAADGHPPDWRFAFHVARTDSTSLVADVTGDPIVSDADPTEFLIGG